MTNVTPLIVLKALAKHETLTYPDLIDKKNLGIDLPHNEIDIALEHLKEQNLITILDGTQPTTFTITEKGVEEDRKLNID